MAETKKLKFFWQGKDYLHVVPDGLPPEVEAQLCAFRAGANWGDHFELVNFSDFSNPDPDTLELVATGTSV